VQRSRKQDANGSGGRGNRQDRGGGKALVSRLCPSGTLARVQGSSIGRGRFVSQAEGGVSPGRGGG